MFSNLTGIVNYHLTLAEEDLKKASANKLMSYICGMKDNLNYLTAYSEELETKGIEEGLAQRIKERANPLVLAH